MILDSSVTPQQQRAWVGPEQGVGVVGTISPREPSENDVSFGRYCCRYNSNHYGATTCCTVKCCGETELRKSVEGVWYLASPTVVVVIAILGDRGRHAGC